MIFLLKVFMALTYAIFIGFYDLGAIRKLSKNASKYQYGNTRMNDYTFKNFMRLTVS